MKKSGWDSSKWQNKVAIRVDNTEGKSPLSHYQVRVVLDSTNFDFTKAQSHGQDLRSTDSDGETLLPYWIEQYDASCEEAVIWVRVPDIPSSASKIIYMYYTNGAVDSASDGTSTFEFFDDCESGSAQEKWEAVTGTPAFKYVPYSDLFRRPGGVWHASSARDRVYLPNETAYGGAHATYCAWTRPMAIYAPSQEKTFFAFGNEDNSPTISYYDHRDKTLAQAVIVGLNPDMDAHKNPHLLIDDEGYLYVFYRSHCTPTYLEKSARPYDISEWVSMGVVAERSSYPQPWQLKRGEIILLYRGGDTHDATEAYVTSRDGGASWSAPTHIVKPVPHNGCYGVSIAETGEYPRKVHFAWSLTRGKWWQRYHVFYAYSDDGGTTWRKSDKSAYELPITESASEMIFMSDVPDRGVWLKDIQLDSKGNPYILFIDAHTITYECVWRLATCSGGKWSLYEVARSDHMYDGGALVILADDDLRVYAPTTPSQPYQDGGEIEEWRSTDGGKTWENTKHLTSGSRYSHNHVKTVFNHQKGDFRVFWNYGDAQNPPETSDVALYWYGEDLPDPYKMDLSYAPSHMPGKCLVVTQRGRVNGAIKVKDLNMENMAIDAKAKAGPLQWESMLCLRATDGICFYGAGIPYGQGKVFKYHNQLSLLSRGKPSKAPQTWREWSFGAFGERLQFAVDGEILADTCDTDMARGAVGARLWNSSLYLDSIRVRKLYLPEPTAALLLR